MRWSKTRVVLRFDPKSVWHLRFAWLPITFEYGCPWNCAWLERVLARRHLVISSEGDYYVWHYAPAEDRIKYPHQYGLGK